MTLQRPLLVLAVVVTLALPLRAVVRGRISDTAEWPRIRRSLAANWMVFVAVASLAVAGRGPSVLGLRVPSVGVLVDGFLFGFIAFAGTMLLVGLLSRFAGGVAADPVSLVVIEQPIRRRLAVAVTGATVETVLFYGLLVEATFVLGGGAVIAGTLTVVAVAAMRIRGGRRHVVQWLPGAVVLVVVAVWSRSVLVVVLIRLLYDSVVLLSGEPEDYRRSANA